MEIDTPATPFTPVTLGENNEIASSDTRPNKRRRKKSIVWEHFTVETVGAGVTRACCNQCKKSFAYITGSKLAGTSHLKRHIALGICPVSRQRNQLATYTPGSKTGSGTDPPKRRYRASSAFTGISFDQEQCSQELAKMIIMEELPLQIVEHSAFTDFVRTLQPHFNMVSFNTIQGDCVSIYLSEKQSLLNLIGGIPGRVNLTLDLWTSNSTMGYVFVTGHFIDDDWNLHRRLLNVIMVPTPESDYAFNQAVVACLSDWHLGSKLFTLTLDQSFSNEITVRNLRGILSVKNPLILNGQLLNGHCYARVISRLVVDAIGFMGEIVGRIRESVKYVKTSESQEERFMQLKQQLQIPSTRELIIDDQKKWNTTYHMLIAACELKQVFDCFDTSDPDYKINISTEDWTQVEILCTYLKLFFDAASILTGPTNPPANMFYHEVSKLHLELTHAAMSTDTVVSNWTRPLREKLDKYWREHFLVFAIAVVMDPRFKMRFIEFSFPKIFGVEDADMWIKHVDDGLHEIFFDYFAPMLSLPASFEEGNDVILKTEASDNGPHQHGAPLVPAGDGVVMHESAQGIIPTDGGIPAEGGPQEVALLEGEPRDGASLEGNYEYATPLEGNSHVDDTSLGGNLLQDDATVGGNPQDRDEVALVEGEPRDGASLEGNYEYATPVEGNSHHDDTSLGGNLLQDDATVGGNPQDGAPVEGSLHDGAPIESKPQDGAPVEAKPQDVAPLDGDTQDETNLNENTHDGAVVGGYSQDGATVLGDTQDEVPIEEGNTQDVATTEGNPQDGIHLEGNTRDGDPLEGIPQDVPLPEGTVQNGAPLDGNTYDGNPQVPGVPSLEDFSMEIDAPELHHQEVNPAEVAPQDMHMLTIGDGLSDFEVYISEITSSQQMKSELDQYLEESVLPRVQEFDILGWWKLNKLKYPTLSRMASEILSIPLSTVAPDSVFDTESKTMDSYRSSLRPVILEALICAKDWLQHASSSSSPSTFAEISNAIVKMEF
ncbi:zinc finger BED domain-containing protein DAYSLEEPER-like [Tripterygium wilfordii]|uniref:zinc finger BED domain-containing protein DAYSLEEPER-like n=1 Tax=Tripterygium wilfordii TaxID=458696 RepID=UPI0018F8321C|nr:zinc finger BED domain-containing protein DAYSLEEPER-like [Tripterygium wilfordii]